MRGRTFFYLLLFIVILALLFEDAECKKKKKKHGHKKKGKSGSRERSGGREKSGEIRWQSYRPQSWRNDRRPRPQQPIWKKPTSSRNTWQTSRYNGQFQVHNVDNSDSTEWFGIGTRRRSWWEKQDSDESSSEESQSDSRAIWGRGSSKSSEQSSSKEGSSHSSSKSSEERSIWGRPKGRGKHGPGKHHGHDKHGPGKHSHGSRSRSSSTEGSKGSSERWGRGSSESDSESSSRESSSSESSSESGEDNSGGVINPNWCWKWCVHYGMYNIERFRPELANKPLWKKKKAVKQYCNHWLFTTGRYMCNETITLPTTPGVSTTTDRWWVGTTEEPERRECITSDDCFEGECCLRFSSEEFGMGYRQIYQTVERAGLSSVKSYCARHADVNERCSERIDFLSAHSSYVGHCPCSEGLSCLSREATMSSASTRLSKMFSVKFDRTRLDWRGKVCRPDERISTEYPSRTTREMITTEPTIMRNVTGGNNITEPPVQNCTTHMDCGFLQCCMRYDKEDEGVCTDFSREGDTCSSLRLYAATSVLSYCPCQSFLQCQRLQNEDKRGFSYKCA